RGVFEEARLECRPGPRRRAENQPRGGCDDSVSEPRIAVVGAGVVGLAVAYHLVKGGANVTLIDRDPAGDKASFGNAGGIAVTEVMPASAPRVLWRALGWMLDPLG